MVQVNDYFDTSAYASDAGGNDLYIVENQQFAITNENAEIYLRMYNQSNTACRLYTCGFNDERRM